MPLFTSNFKKTFITFLAIFVLFGGYKLYYISYCVPEQNRTTDKKFWYKKTFASNDNDIILVGDSRIYRGLSPAAMNVLLKKNKILNFGYSSAGFDPYFLDEAVKKLSDDLRYLSPSSDTAAVELENKMFILLKEIIADPVFSTPGASNSNAVKKLAEVTLLFRQRKTIY